MRFYLSHSIRGKYGDDATHTQMKENCDRAILIANVLRATFPSIEIYCPAEHEDFVLIAYQKHYLDEKQILDVDCTIINACQGVLVCVPEDDELQGGRLIEHNHAIMRYKPVVVFAEVDQVVKWLTHHLLRG